MADLDEIKRRNRLEDFFNVTQSGNVCCPFHKESHPSCTVDIEKQVWYCHVCHIGGSVIDYIAKSNSNWSLWEVIQFLAKRVGIELEDNTSAVNTRYLSILGEAAVYCHRQLNNASRKELMAWKGLTANTIDEWQIGYSGGLVDYLLDFATMEELEAVGLIHEGKARFYDRLMIPIRQGGKVVGFAGRAERKPKYINSPNSEIFNKSNVLFGLNPTAIRQAGYVTLVEGYFDVIKLHQQGYQNVVASMGTSFTKAQARILANLASELRVVYDGDIAGSGAVWGVAESLLQRKLEYRYKNMPLFGTLMNLSVGQCPDGFDPDELTRDEWENVPFTPFIDRLEAGITRKNVGDYVGLAYGFLDRVEADARIAQWSGQIKQDLPIKLTGASLGDRFVANYLASPTRFNLVFDELRNLVGLTDNQGLVGLIPNEAWHTLGDYIRGQAVPLIAAADEFNELVIKDFFLEFLRRELEHHKSDPRYVRVVLQRMSNLSEW